MVAPSKITFDPPAPRTNLQAKALRTATSTGLIADHHMRKEKVLCYYEYLRRCAPYKLTPAQLADINLRQRSDISKLNQELDLKLASIFMDNGLPDVVQSAAPTKTEQAPVKAEQCRAQGELAE